jgi:hypothetical protein
VHSAATSVSPIHEKDTNGIDHTPTISKAFEKHSDLFKPLSFALDIHYKFCLNDSGAVQVGERV